MPELRMDLITHEWVVIATERSRRPNDFRKPSEDGSPKPEHVPNCPFCVGGEAMTPPEVEAFREAGTAPDTPGWWVRTVPNKFPALAPQGDLSLRMQGVYTLTDGVGAHEVIIETPKHNETPSTMPTHQWREVIRMYQNRLRALAQDTRFKCLLPFRNEGKPAGASLEHPHSQLVALPFVPPVLQAKLDGITRFQAEQGRHPFEVVLEFERREGTRVILDTEHYLVYAPYASRSPFEVQIVPKTPRAHFADLPDEERDAFADMLQETLKRLDTVLSSPPYNFMLFTAPVNTNTDVSAFWWHLRIAPRLSIDAGFELGTGMGINITAPEDTARYLREAVAPEQAVAQH